ncbi:MAG: sigma-54-dependent Fis family transcriptional regulator [Bdellovibrionales bacterium]|nr:sigma-54-dependent Fis family transcriptional regulator [Bdellovibrionales bacterium]
MTNRPSVLLVDDDSDALVSLARALSVQSLNATIEASSSLSKAKELIRDNRPAVAVVDLSFDVAKGVEGGFELLAFIRGEVPECRAIVLTGHGSVEYGVRSLDMGASNFLEKPANIPHLSALIRDGLAQADLFRRYESLKTGQEEDDLESFLVGTSEYASRLREQIRYLAATGQSVLITGETGTGKGVCAAALHRLSSATGKFVRYQPGLGGADLIGSELFGHVKGAFTGAEADRTGIVESAVGGTLFLDEMDELPSSVQVALLGLLQDHAYRRLGDSVERKAHFRLIAATNADIEQALNEKKIRADFFHRIAHERIDLLPLREHSSDVKDLALHFVEQSSAKDGVNVYGIENGALSTLSRYSWPGNVRELQAVVEGACFRAQHRRAAEIGVQDLRIGMQTAPARNEELSFREQVEQFKSKLVQDALERNSGNQAQAAKELQLDRSSFRRILQR